MPRNGSLINYQIEGAVLGVEYTLISSIYLLVRGNLPISTKPIVQQPIQTEPVQSIQPVQPIVEAQPIVQPIVQPVQPIVEAQPIVQQPELNRSPTPLRLLL